MVVVVGAVHNDNNLSVGAGGGLQRPWQAKRLAGLACKQLDGILGTLGCSLGGLLGGSQWLLHQVAASWVVVAVVVHVEDLRLRVPDLVNMVTMAHCGRRGEGRGAAATGKDGRARVVSIEHSATLQIMSLAHAEVHQPVVAHNTYSFNWLAPATITLSTACIQHAVPS